MSVVNVNCGGGGSCSPCSHSALPPGFGAGGFQGRSDQNTRAIVDRALADDIRRTRRPSNFPFVLLGLGLGAIFLAVVFFFVFRGGTLFAKEAPPAPVPERSGMISPQIIQARSHEAQRLARDGHLRRQAAAAEEEETEEKEPVAAPAAVPAAELAAVPDAELAAVPAAEPAAVPAAELATAAAVEPPQHAQAEAPAQDTSLYGLFRAEALRKRHGVAPTRIAGRPTTREFVDPREARLAKEPADIASLTRARFAGGGALPKPRVADTMSAQMRRRRWEMTY
jgi:hypothetical protein